MIECTIKLISLLHKGKIILESNSVDVSILDRLTSCRTSLTRKMESNKIGTNQNFFFIFSCFKVGDDTKETPSH